MNTAPSFSVPASAGVHTQSTKPQSVTPDQSTTSYTPPSEAAKTTTPFTSANAKRAVKTHTKRKKGRGLTLSHEAIVAVALAGLLILMCLLWGAMRWLAFEPRWMLSARHSLEEAGFRISASLSEFADWVRLGR